MAKKKITKGAFAKKLRHMCGIYLTSYSLLDWGMTTIICEYLSPKTHNPIIYLLNNVSSDVKVKLYLEVLQVQKFINEKEAETLNSNLKKLIQIRNKFAHSLIITPELNDYSNCDYFHFHSLGKIFEQDLRKVKYTFAEYEKDLASFASITNFNHGFVEIMIDEILLEDLEKLNQKLNGKVTPCPHCGNSMAKKS